MSKVLVHMGIYGQNLDAARLALIAAKSALEELHDSDSPDVRDMEETIDTLQSEVDAFPGWLEGLRIELEGY